MWQLLGIVFIILGIKTLLFPKAKTFSSAKDLPSEFQDFANRIVPGIHFSTQFNQFTNEQISVDDKYAFKLNRPPRNYHSQIITCQQAAFGVDLFDYPNGTFLFVDHDTLLKLDGMKTYCGQFNTPMQANLWDDWDANGRPFSFTWEVYGNNH